MVMMIKKPSHSNAHFYQALSQKIILIVILVSFTPLFLISGFILKQFDRSYCEKVHAHLGELVEKHCQNINRFLLEQTNTLRYFSDNHPFEQLIDEHSLTLKLSQLQDHFSGVFEDLGVIDDRGLQISYAGPFKLMKAHYGEADWFKRSMIHEYFISDVFLGLRGLPHFIVAVRKEYQGRQWILRATINFTAFNNLVENLQVGKTGFAFILNRAEAFQTRLPAGSLTGKGHYLRFLENTPPKNGKVQIFEDKDESGHTNIYAGAFLKNGEWLLVYQQDTADAYRDLKQTRHVAFLIIVVGGIVIISTAFLITRRMVKRIMAADREKNMLNRQVIETGKLAAIGELAAGIAHEINNPVAIMMEKAGWIKDLLEEEEFKEGENLTEFEDSLEEIKNQARRCKEITHKLLSFARKTDSRPQPVQLNELLTDVIELSRQRAKYAGVLLRKDLYPELPVIEASPTEMQQVFLNLINNAMDAMKKEGGEIDISTTVHGDEVIVKVADTGQGMSEANIEKIFDPFFTTKPVGKGTGLGLSICYGIINKLSGNIDVKSEIEKGTTFWIHLPITSSACLLEGESKNKKKHHVNYLQLKGVKNGNRKGAIG